MEERGEDASRLYVPRPSRNLNQTTKKGKRDVYRSSFGAIMGDRLCMYFEFFLPSPNPLTTKLAEICFKAGLFTAEQVKTATMVWNEKFLDLAFRGKFRIINYPVVLENIGQVIGAEQFNTKAPNVKEYESFMPALERAAKKGTDEDPEGEPVIRIVPWEPSELLRALCVLNSLTTFNSGARSTFGRPGGSAPRCEHRRACSPVGPTQPRVWRRCCRRRETTGTTAGRQEESRRYRTATSATSPTSRRRWIPNPCPGTSVSSPPSCSP